MVKFSELLKLPEGEPQFEDFIKIPLFLFRVTQFRFETLDPQASSKERFKHYARLAYVAFCVVCFALAFASMCTLALTSLDNFALASSCIMNSASVTSVALKLLVSIFGKKTLSAMFVELEALSKKRLSRTPSSKRVYGVKGYLQTLNFHVKAIFWVDLIMFLPVLFPVVQFLRNGTMKHSVNYFFPFNPYQPHIFPFALAWIDFLAWNYLIYSSSVDSLLYALITAIQVEFNVLKVDWLALTFSAKHERHKLISDMIDRHNRLLDLVASLQSVYSCSLLVSFVITSFIMCFSCFQLSIAQNLDALIFYGAYFLLVLSHIWFLCLYGQKLINSSEAVAEAVYHCEWESIRDENLKKKLILVMLRAQKPAKLTAMGFADISFPTFTSILTTTGSYFTLLQNVYSREN